MHQGKEKLTRSMQPRRQHGHRPGLQHLFIQILLFEAAELLFQLALVDRFARLWPVGDGVADFLREGALFAEAFPVRCVRMGVW